MNATWIPAISSCSLSNTRTNENRKSPREHTFGLLRDIRQHGHCALVATGRELQVVDLVLL